MKHPYESGGIMFTIAIVAGILGGIAFDNFNDDMHNGGHEFVNEEVGKYVKPSAPAGGGWADYYKNNMNAQLDCKKTSTNLQEFYDCVNG